MFNARKISQQVKSFTCTIGAKSYSLAAIGDKNELLFNRHQEFSERSIASLGKCLAEDVDKFNLVGVDCHLILAPGQYQLVQMDALDVPDGELAKALRWQMKGLIDYPLNDISVDAFLVPPYGVGGQRKKAFVAATPMSGLKSLLAIFDFAFVKLVTVSIADLALKKVLNLLTYATENSVLLINLSDSFRQIQVIFHQHLYLVRQLPVEQLSAPNSSGAEKLVLEIQRSIDYILSELKLPEPKQLIVFPGSEDAIVLSQLLGERFNKEVIVLDLAQYITMPTPLNLKEQDDALYSLCGALPLSQHEGRV